jgi:hypothetical protein
MQNLMGLTRQDSMIRMRQKISFFQMELSHIDLKNKEKLHSLLVPDRRLFHNL